MPDQLFEMTFAKQNAAQEGFNLWTINGNAFTGHANMQPIFQAKSGKRYRLGMRNAGDDTHPIHLHCHTFELTKVAGQPTAGVKKDTVMVGGYQEMEIDFVADNPDLTLFTATNSCTWISDSWASLNTSKRQRRREPVYHAREYCPPPI